MAAHHYPDGWTYEAISALQLEVYDELKREGYPRPHRTGAEHESRRLGATETATVDRCKEPAVHDRVTRLAAPDSGEDDAPELARDAA